jgi:hypothetical protein
MPCFDDFHVGFGKARMYQLIFSLLNSLYIERGMNVKKNSIEVPCLVSILNHKLC